MAPDGLAKEFVLAIGGRHPAGQQPLDQATQAALERHRRLQVVHHAQRHGLVPLLLQRHRQAIRLHRLDGIEGRRQGDAVTAIAHRPTVVVVQVVGVAQQRGRLPVQALQGLEDCRLGADMIGMRIQGRMRQHDDLGPGPQQQFAQIGQQVVPGRCAIGIAWQRERIQLAK
ncbi:hypothetical protein D3C76_1097730 [compost metagenome]